MTTSMVERDLPAARACGERIHTIIWSRRLTQADVARHVGVSPSTFAKKLRGTVPITVDELLAVARLLAVEPGDLLPSVGAELPRLDSNQQPSGYGSPQVSGVVVDLASWRKRTAVAS